MYILDTNICIYLINNRNNYLKNKLLSYDPNEIALSVISISELLYGVYKSNFIEKNKNALIKFASSFNNILEYTVEDSENYGMIRAYLEKKGTPIGPYDMQIAAQGLSRNYTIVTNNVKEFSRIPGLLVEDWSKYTFT